MNTKDDSSMSGTNNPMDIVLFPELGLTTRGLGFEDKDVEFYFRRVEFKVIGRHLKGKCLVGDWTSGSIAQKS